MNQQVKWLQEYLDSNPIFQEFQNAIDSCIDWSLTKHSYDSKNIRIREWNPEYEEIYSIVGQIFINCLLQPQGTTYQAMIGSIAGFVKCADPLDRAKCAAEIIALCFQAELIEIEKLSDQTMIIYTEFELDEDIPEFGKHMPMFQQPKRLDSNSILGNRFKQHEFETCTDHLDRMNSIPLCLEFRIIDEMEEYQKADMASEQWEDFKRRSRYTYEEVRASGNRFWLNHAYDTRGRVYCEGYYINYQGSSYKKAIVQLADKEVVKL